MFDEEDLSDSIPATDEKTEGSPMLTFEEARVLGCLLEKEATTPDHYPLTMNALFSACNQSSNRDPVVDFGTDTVQESLEGLRYKKLALLVHQAGARVEKCKHTLENEFPYLTGGQSALLCVLLLRGQQTIGELRQRTHRMHPFADVERTRAVLQEMIDNKPKPIVREMPTGGGHRVPTFVHMLCGDVAPGDHAVMQVPETAAALGWREEMEGEMATLKEVVGDLQEELERLKNELGA